MPLLTLDEILVESKNLSAKPYSFAAGYMAAIRNMIHTTQATMGAVVLPTLPEMQDWLQETDEWPINELAKTENS